MFAARLGVGVGEAVCAPAGNSLIGDLFPAAKRGWALSIFQLGLPVGYLLGGMVSGHVAASYGWRWAFFVACLPGLLVALLARWVLDPVRGASEASPQAGRSHVGNPYWAVLRVPTVCWIIVTGALYNFNSYTYVTFLPAYLSRYHGLNLSQANVVFAIVFGAFGVVGLLLGGWAADRISHHRRSGRLLVGGVSLLLSAVSVYFALNLPRGASDPVHDRHGDGVHAGVSLLPMRVLHHHGRGAAGPARYRNVALFHGHVPVRWQLRTGDCRQAERSLWATGNAASSVP